MSDIVNVDKFIKEQNAKEVTNPKMFESGSEIVPTKDGLFSIDLFGPLHTDMRRKQWGYVKLGRQVVHPAALNILANITPALQKVALGTQKYTIKDGVLVSDPERGSTGPSYLKEVLKKIDWKKIPGYEKKADFINKIKSLKDKIFIDKWIILPAGLRDYTVRNGRVTYEDINEMYQKLISLVSSDSHGLTQYLDAQQESKDILIQRQLRDIYNYYINRLSSKEGLIRGSMIKKRSDFVARLVASALPEVPPHALVVPWGALINLFAPLVIHEIENDEKLYKIINGTDKHVSVHEYSSKFQYIFKNMATVAREYPEMKTGLIKALKKIIEENGLMVTYKRDPAFGNTSWWSGYPIIDVKDVYSVVLPSMMYKPLGGDSIELRSVVFFGDNHKVLLNQSHTIKFENGTACMMSLRQYHKKLMRRR